MPNPVFAYIGLGGNIGNVFANMRAALNALEEHDEISLVSTSNIYKTPPWGIENQDWFLNACACVKTSLSASSLLDECLRAEKGLNRIRDIRWGPRTIDLDVLIYGEEIIDSEKLQVPHPRMHERGFVLLPMADIAPNITLKDKTIKQWLEAIDVSEIQKTNLAFTE